jgi:hypothetical protein
MHRCVFELYAFEVAELGHGKEATSRLSYDLPRQQAVDDA